MKNFPEKIAELWGWLVILLAFIGLGILVTAMLLYLLSGLIGIITGLAAALLDIYLGIRIATSIYKGKGTIHALSRTSATPELAWQRQSLSR